MIKHTPGPWEAVFATADGTPAGTGAFVSKDGGSIARVHAYGMCGTDEQMREDAMANARVLAAAPDLLAVVEDLFALEELYESGGEATNEQALAWRSKAMAAMKKARGEQ